MSDYLVRLAARSLGLLDTIQPRMTSLFEPPPMDDGLTSENNYERVIRSETIEPKPIESIQPNIDELSLSSRGDPEHKSIHVSDKISNEPERGTADGDPTKPILQRSTVIASRSGPSTTVIKLSAGDHRGAEESEPDKLDRQLSEKSSQSYFNDRCTKPSMENCGIIQEPKPVFKDAGSSLIRNIRESEEPSFFDSASKPIQNGPTTLPLHGTLFGLESADSSRPQAKVHQSIVERNSIIGKSNASTEYNTIIYRKPLQPNAAISEPKKSDLPSPFEAHTEDVEDVSSVSASSADIISRADLSSSECTSSENISSESISPGPKPLFVRNEPYMQGNQNIIEQGSNESSSPSFSKTGSEPKVRIFNYEHPIKREANGPGIGDQASSPSSMDLQNTEFRETPGLSPIDASKVKIQLEENGLGQNDLNHQSHTRDLIDVKQDIIGAKFPARAHLNEVTDIPGSNASIHQLQSHACSGLYSRDGEDMPNASIASISESFKTIRSEITKGGPTNSGDSTSLSHTLKYNIADPVTATILSSSKAALRSNPGELLDASRAKAYKSIKKHLSDTLNNEPAEKLHLVENFSFSEAGSEPKRIQSKDEHLIKREASGPGIGDKVLSSSSVNLQNTEYREASGSSPSEASKQAHQGKAEIDMVHLVSPLQPEAALAAELVFAGDNNQSPPRDLTVHSEITKGEPTNSDDSPSSSHTLKSESIIYDIADPVTATILSSGKAVLRSNSSILGGNKSLERSNQNRFISDGSSRKEQTSSIIKYHSKNPSVERAALPREPIADLPGSFSQAESINHIIAAVEPRRTRIADRELQASSETAAKTDPRSKIKVTIGRIEVRAATQLSPSQQTNRASMSLVPSAPRLSLDSYLKRRSEGKI